MMEASQTVNLYITYVEKEGPFLKVWGQTEKNNSIYVEQFLLGTGPQFDLGIGKLPIESLQPGTLVCAKYKDNKYYRARITNISFVREGFVEVSFLDYGNKDIVPCGNIRNLQNFPSSFISIPPLATGFIFAEAHCPGGGEWNEVIFENISKEIKYREVQCTLLIQATQYFLVKLFLAGNDLCAILINRGLMQPISLQAQQAVLLSMSMQRQSIPPPQSAPPTSTGINTYKACTLEPGCQYPVYVSYVNDGPCHFSVQLKQSEEVLVMLMNDINTIALRLLEDIPIPGTICLARCQEDGNICRAVVTNEVDNQFKVFYVDFGNYEVVPLDALYQIPFKYVLPKVMAIRFALAGVEKSTVTIEMQCSFKQFVDNRLLHMKVLPAPTRMAIPKCELWDPETKTSALDVVNRAAQNAYPEPVSLNRGFSQPVKVSYVYSCNRFYVQLVCKENELLKLMLDLQESCQTNDPMDLSSIKVGLPCCALFESDSQWYRSQIVEVLGDSVKVRYIDYGNEEVVPGSQLKIIDGEHLTVLRPQAIECCLNGYQNMEEDIERDGFLEELVLEQQFTMKVVEMTNKKALVELFDNLNYNIASLLLDKLATAKSQVSPMLVQAGNIIEHRKSVSHQNGPRDQNFKNERKPGREKNYDRTNDKNDKPWRQDNKDFRNHDKNSNENNEKSSWRQNNRGFSPNNERHNNRDKNRNSSNNNQSWDNTNDTVQKSNDDWNTPTNNDSSHNNPRENEFGRNKNRYDNDKGSWNSKGGAIKKRNDFRKDGSELSSSGSEKSHMGPRTSSRNDRHDRPKYPNKFDKPRNSSFNSSGGAGDSWNVSAVTPPINAAPVTATYTPVDAVGTESKVIISWFHNPGHFYCQLEDVQNQFKTMMDEIQQFYKTRKPESAVVGAPVIGLFPEDSVLYRAQVLETIGNEYKVYYVDFGNVSTITKVWPIEKKFMSLPAQAIVCSLSEVVPPGDKWPDTDNYSKHFERDSFTCRFINKDEEKTYVNLYYGQDDIAQLLVQEGLAVSVQESIPEIEIPLLLGQQFRAVIKSINNLSDVIIALECGLAISCQMHNLETATETFDDTLKGLLEQTVIVYVDNVIDYRLEVTLYDTEGSKLVILNPDEGAYESVEALCPPLILRSTLIGYVSHVDESSVFIQPTDYAQMIPYLLEQMYVLYENQKQDLLIIPEEGLLYAVRSQDGNWYRAKVITFDDEQATVTYVDYGNSENVAFSQLRELADIFLEICTLCVQVFVNVDTANFLDAEVIATVTYGENGWEGPIELQVPGESSATESEVAERDNFERRSATEDSQKHIVENQEAVNIPEVVDDQKTDYVQESATAQEVGDFTETTTPATVIPDPSVENIAVQNGTQVIVSHIDSPNEFYVQLAESLSAIDELQLHLQEEVTDMPVLEVPTAGVLCAAPYSADQQWYRAEVLDADDDITTVRFVDYGNTDVIDNKTTQIKTLPPNLLSLAVYATRCSLKISATDEEWSTSAIERFEVLANAGTVSAEFIDQDEKTNYVELYTDDQNIKDILIQESLGVLAELTVESKSTCFVSHLNSPSEFWIQLENCIDELEWIAEQLSGAEKFAELEDLTPGTLCAALFPDDEMWYRARILSNTVAGLELLFIDYGNSCTSNSLRQLPEDLVVTPPLAQKCSLQKPDGILYWSLQGVNKFNEISADGQTIFTVRKISTGETSVVQLMLNGEDVASMLLPVTENGYVKDVESLENFHIEKNGEILTEYYKLESMPGMAWNEESTDKFKALNSQGTTLFQIEFISENAVRLYLNGSDIRINLGGIKMSSLNVSKTEITEDETDKIDDNCLDESTVYEQLSENTEELTKVGSDNEEIKNSEGLDDVPQNISVEETNLDEFLTSEPQVCDSKISDEIVSKNDQVKPLEKDEKEESRSESTPTDDSKNDQIESSDKHVRDLLLEDKEQLESNDGNSGYESTEASFVHNEIEEADISSDKKHVDDSATLDASNDDIDKMKDGNKSPQKETPGDSLVQNKEELESKIESESTRIFDDKTVSAPKKDSENGSSGDTNKSPEVASSLHDEIEDTDVDSNKKQYVDDSATLDATNVDAEQVKDQDKLPQKDVTQASLTQNKQELELKVESESTQSVGGTNENLEVTSLPHAKYEEADIGSDKKQYVDDSATLDVSNGDIDKIKDQDKSPQKDITQASLIENEEKLEPKVEPELTRTVIEKTATSSKKNSGNTSSSDTNEILEVASLLHEEIEKALNKKDEQTKSRPSSSCSGRIKHDDRILPGAVSRPHTPVEQDLSIDEPKSESEGLSGSEVASILKDLIDDALDKEDDVEVKSRPQSSGSGKISHDERIVPASVSRSHSPLQSDDNVKG